MNSPQTGGRSRRGTWWRGYGGRTLRSLRIRNYRLYVSGHAVSVIGTWMQRVAQDWLVLDLTDSAVAVGVAASLQFVPLLFFGLWGGVLVDRADRRRLLVWTQAASALLAGLLASLVMTGVVTVWMVFALSFTLGLVTVVDNPARHSFVAQLVAPGDYVNGQALASTVHNTGRLVGPAIAGVLIAAVGPGPVFVVNAVSFVGVLWGLLLIDASKLRVVAAREGDGRGQVRAGLRYVVRHPELRACILLIAVVAVFGQNFRVVLPLMARDDLGGGAELYGWLTSALGAGAVLGALLTASRERVTGRSLLVAALGFGVVNLLVAGSVWLWAALVGMVLVGAFNITFNTIGRTLMQLETDPSLHGRVMAVHMVVFSGSTPIGGPLIGWICEAWGARAGLVVGGATTLLAAALLATQLRGARPDGAQLPNGRPPTTRP